MLGSGGIFLVKFLFNMFDINVKKCFCFVLFFIKFILRDFVFFRVSFLLFGISGLFGFNGKGVF